MSTISALTVIFAAKLLPRISPEAMRGDTPTFPNNRPHPKRKGSAKKLRRLVQLKLLVMTVTKIYDFARACGVNTRRFFFDTRGLFNLCNHLKLLGITPGLNGGFAH